MSRATDSLANILIVAPMLLIMLILLPVTIVYIVVCGFVARWRYARLAAAIGTDRNTCFF